MDLFDMVRAAPPPPAEDGKDEAEVDSDASPKVKAFSPSSSPMPMTPLFNLEDSDTETIPRSPLVEDATTPPPLIISLDIDDENTEDGGIRAKNKTKIQASKRTSLKKTFKDSDEDSDKTDDSDSDDSEDEVKKKNNVKDIDSDNYSDSSSGISDDEEDEKKKKNQKQKYQKQKEEDEEEEEDQEDLLQIQPRKTKGEQKMFTDATAASKKQTGKKASTTGVRRCMVRIKRLTQSQIDYHTNAKGKGKGKAKAKAKAKPKATEKKGKGKDIKHKKPRKRLASISDCSSVESSPSSAKKPKSSKAKVHVKVPFQQNGSKPRSSLNTSRVHTPPPSLKKSPKRLKPLKASKAMIKKYGSRFFNCYVKMKRLKDPGVSSTSKRAKRKSKSNLSVSFSEAVEILGSKPRKSSSIAGALKQTTNLNSSVPTRLQRVDATGNVLEDIELKPDTVLKSSNSSGGQRKRGRQPACNGGKRNGNKLKRPAVRVPVTDLASLRIDDSQDEEEPLENDAGEEYIVPNDMPACKTSGVHRSYTPTPQKRVAVVTTTVSDVEDADESQPQCKMKKTAASENKNKNEEKAESEDEQKQADETKDSDETDTERESEQPSPEKPQKAKQPEQSDSSNSSPLLTVLTDDVTTDDILEIQASMEDVRELHTPPSRQDTPLLSLPSTATNNRDQRSESPESESSFKSADDLESSVAIEQTSSVQSASPGQRQANTSDSFVDDQSTSPAGTPSTRGENQQSMYAPIIDMPNLDDDLGPIIEPNFQMANSLNSNSRLTMEDILTVFET
ncbi:AT-rich interactive domain-containing protein 4B isoform X1 [Drosophila mojavensis]|uniref:AT-rich interactive domain-containing protein 4B isoform X1 n=1 Tax=Drosophila mojavensis TaxID=7230 RepID=UPI001CD153D1|nr:AT-rich interactive domain-containing protein 4B isoform X1 [Drosophila mojavensis]XP_043863212.1 AT-rich interactive domain-containing protein 4B isoform X1 [Drosophila mojavensis]